jgi:hypothetical protein
MIRIHVPGNRKHPANGKAEVTHGDGATTLTHDPARVLQQKKYKGGRSRPCVLLRRSGACQPQLSAVMLAYQPVAYLASSSRKPSVASLGLTPPSICTMPLSVIRYTPATEMP